MFIIKILKNLINIFLLNLFYITTNLIYPYKSLSKKILLFFILKLIYRKSFYISFIKIKKFNGRIIKMNNIEILIPEEARKILKVGKSTMQDLLHRKDFPSYRIGRRWYIKKEKLIEWINNQ